MAILFAILWGSLAAQFLMQAVVSFIITIINLIAIIFSQVRKAMNMAGTLACSAQSIMYAVLFVVGNWIVSEYLVEFERWNAPSIASLVSFAATIIYIIPQLPGKILLARMCAWTPNFMEAQMHQPRGERVAFARKWRMEKSR